MGSSSSNWRAGAYDPSSRHLNVQNLARALAQKWRDMDDADHDGKKADAFYEAAVKVLDLGLMEECLDELEELAQRQEFIDPHDLAPLRMDLTSVVGMHEHSAVDSQVGRVLIIGVPLGGDFHEIHDLVRLREEDLLEMVLDQIAFDGEIELARLGVLRAGESLSMASDTAEIARLTQSWLLGAEMKPEDLDPWRMPPPERSDRVVVPGGHVLVVAAKKTARSLSELESMAPPDPNDEDDIEQWMEAIDGRDFGNTPFGLPAELGRAGAEAVSIHLEMNAVLARMSMDEGEDEDSPNLERVMLQARMDEEGGFDLHAHFSDGSHLVLDAAVPEGMTGILAAIAENFTCSAAIDYGDGKLWEVDAEEYTGMDMEDEGAHASPKVMMPGNRTLH